jgi:hypothetical protein
MPHSNTLVSSLFSLLSLQLQEASRAVEAEKEQLLRHVAAAEQDTAVRSWYMLVV